MRIYSNIIVVDDVLWAFRQAREQHGQDIHIEDIRTWKPRGYDHGVEVWGYADHGRYGSGRGTPGLRAASWDAWGYVIAYLFNTDPHARVGWYDNEAHFVEMVRKHPRTGSDLPFLQVLDNIKEYD